MDRKIKTTPVKRLRPSRVKRNSLFGAKATFILISIPIRIWMGNAKKAPGFHDQMQKVASLGRTLIFLPPVNLRPSLDWTCLRTGKNIIAVVNNHVWRAR
jgi:hypothetical protein